MKEIKFRAKDLTGEKWLYGFVSRGEYSFWSIRKSTDEQPTPVIFETIGQYTGLKDKNGKEIYEGDIIRCYEKTDDFSKKEYPNLLSVHFDAIAGGFFAQDEREKMIFNIWRDFAQYEVVGNIYDNLDYLVKNACVPTE